MGERSAVTMVRRRATKHAHPPPRVCIIRGMSKPTAMWRVLFLAEQYGRMTMSLEEVATQIALAPGTIRNRRTRGEFGWLRADGRSLYADVADVAAYLDERRCIADATPQS